MSSLRTPLAAAAVLAAALAAGKASASDTQLLTVTTTVPGVCKLTAVPAMSFMLDPSNSSQNGVASSAVQFKCTRGSPAGTFTVGGVSDGSAGYSSGAGNALIGSGGNSDKIAYTITWTTPSAFTGTGFGSGSSAATVNLNGFIPYANYANVAADTYSGTVAITINP